MKPLQISYRFCLHLFSHFHSCRCTPPYPPCHWIFAEYSMYSTCPLYQGKKVQTSRTEAILRAILTCWVMGKRVLTNSKYFVFLNKVSAERCDCIAPHLPPQLLKYINEVEKTCTGTQLLTQCFHSRTKQKTDYHYCNKVWNSVATVVALLCDR